MPAMSANPLPDQLRRLAIAMARNVEILDSGTFFQRKEREMAKRYYSLIVQESQGERFCPQFGDYNKGVVAAELEDWCDNGYKTKQLWIIESGDTQTEINSTVAKFNAGHANVNQESK